MKKTIFSIIIIIIAAGAAIGFTIWSKKHVPVTPVTSPVSTSDESKYLVTKEPQMISVAEDSFLLGITGSYPQFSQVDAAFNAEIAKTFTDDIVSFKKIANDNYQAGLENGGDDFQRQFAENGGYTLEVTTDVVQSNEHYISAVIHYGGYSGGAHGSSSVITFNYDVKNHKELGLADFMSLEKASLESRAQLQTKFEEEGNFDASIKSMMYDGTDPKKSENFQNLTFLSDAITIYFGEYQVGPYALGEQMVEILRK